MSRNLADGAWHPRTRARAILGGEPFIVVFFFLFFFFLFFFVVVVFFSFLQILFELAVISIERNHSVDTSMESFAQLVDLVLGDGVPRCSDGRL